MNTPDRFTTLLQTTEQRYTQRFSERARKAKLAPKRVLGSNDLLPVLFLHQGLTAARAVARIHIRSADNALLGYGTGFLVSPRLLLTNNHVLANATDASNSQAEFNFETGENGSIETSASFALDPDSLFLTDEALDYTLVALRPDPALAAYGWLPLPDTPAKPLLGEWLNIIQHPNGEPKQLALRENQVVDELEQFLHYRTDTAPGSSGSPVCNDRWEVVALHHSGVPQRDAEGRILNTDGQVWNPAMGEQRIAWKANEGVRISQIAAHIQAQALTPAQQELCAGLFVAPTPTAPETANSDLQDALDALVNANEREYYNAGTDQAAAEDYYRDIQTDAQPAELFTQLSELLRATHTETFAYKPSKHVYPWVDLHPDLKIRSIYSSKGFEPEELIHEDFRIDQQRSACLRDMLLHEASLSRERLELELDLLEATLPYNCEHVVPQSWFQKKEPMRGDLHHLFACESGCNSFRGNTPYYDFPDFEEALRDACGKRDADKFEPGNGKGAVARAALYFLLRYPGMVGDEEREMQRERLPILLAWHNSFPPDEYEHHRNAAIFDMQHNRNPLIDHPEWAERIDFGQGMS
ncbi:MAG: endonuclease [Thiothrix sp.]